MWLESAGASVSVTSELLPDPDTPVTTVSEPRGIATSTDRRLFWRAPITVMWPRSADRRCVGTGMVSSPDMYRPVSDSAQCEACKGDGQIKIEMHFLPDVYVPCEVCKGARYNRETLQVTYKGKTVSDILEMSVEEALHFFENIPPIKRKFQTLYDVGLGYIKLGQPATTLSGGEAQRVKLASELQRRSTGKTFYILDEPTTGLHFDDVRQLLAVLQRLVDAGNTVLVIEHNLDVVKSADHIIDLGPEGGDAGGEIVVAGTPEDVAAHPTSHTGRFLRPVLEGRGATVEPERAGSPA